MRKLVFTSLFILIAIALFVPISHAQYCTPSWSTAPSNLSTATTKAGGGAYFAYLYFWGGVNSAGVGQTTTKRYYAYGNTWTTLAPLPEAKWFGGSAIVDNYGYAIAGWNSPFAFTTSSFQYDIWDNSWSAIADYPQTWGKMACTGGGDGKLYCFGGADLSGNYADSYVYDPATNAWTAITSLPYSTAAAAVAYNEADGLIYIACGWVYLTNSYTYDPVTDTYATLSPAITGRHWGNMAVGGGVPWLTAGADSWVPVTANDEYFGTSWTSAGSTVSTPVIAAVGGYIPWYGFFLLGGQNGSADSSAISTNQMWQPCVPLWEETDANIGMPGDTLTITGSNFQSGATAWLYDSQKAVYPLTSISVTDSTTMAGDVPAGLAPGMYGLAIENDLGQLMTLDGAFYASEIAEELIQDDGSNESGYSAPPSNSHIVQQFTLPSGSAKLKRVAYRSNSYTSIFQPLRLVVYVENTVKGKAAPSGSPVYTSEPFYVDYPRKWNVIDLSEVAAIQSQTITGTFYIGTENPDTNSLYGPYIGVDQDATLNDIAWLYDASTSTWTNLSTDHSTTGALMFRPTVEYGCLIGGVPYENMALNPANSCLQCDVSNSVSAWTPLADAMTCDDGLFCTVDDSCSAGVCSGAARDCDDGEFCTGVETCNDTTDSCDSAGDPCSTDETCNETTDACDPAGDDDDDDDDDTTDDDDDDTADDDDDDDTAPSGGGNNDDDDGCCGC